MKHIKSQEQFLNEQLNRDETSPEYYLQFYKDEETFTSVKHNTYKETKYTGSEYRELFMKWYDKIKPFLENDDENEVKDILIDWDEETLAKFDMYSLVRRYFNK